jgi:hypothetical protein
VQSTEPHGPYLQYTPVKTAVRNRRAAPDLQLVFSGKKIAPTSLPSLLPRLPSHSYPPHVSSALPHSLPPLLMRYGDPHSHIRSPAPAPSPQVACPITDLDLARILIGDVAAPCFLHYMPAVTNINFFTYCIGVGHWHWGPLARRWCQNSAASPPFRWVSADSPRS